MTITALPFVNKLSSDYTKTGSFKVHSCKANNQYLRKIGIGKDNYDVAYDLKYIGLTVEEVTSVETLFGVQLWGDLLSFKAPIDRQIGYYLKPSAWKKDNYYGWWKGNPYQKLCDISFTLVLGGVSTGISKSILDAGFLADWTTTYILNFQNNFGNSVESDPNNLWNVTIWAGTPSYVSNGSGGLAVTDCVFVLDPTIEDNNAVAIEFSVMSTIYDNVLVEGTSANPYITITANGYLKIEDTITSEVMYPNIYYSFIFKQIESGMVEIYLKKEGTYQLVLTSFNPFLVRGNLEFNSPWGRDMSTERIDFVKLYVKGSMPPSSNGVTFGSTAITFDSTIHTMDKFI